MKKKIQWHFPIYLLLFLCLISSKNSHAQNESSIKLETRNASDAIKNLFNSFVYKELNAMNQGNENTIKLYSIRFYIDSNLNASNISLRGKPSEKIRLIVQSITRAVFDSVRRMDLDFSAFKNKVILVPLIMYIKPMEDKQMLAVINEDMIASLYDLSPDADYFYSSEVNIILFSPIRYYNPRKMSSWGNKFKKKSVQP